MRECISREDAVALMRPSKSVMDMELKSVKKLCRSMISNKKEGNALFFYCFENFVRISISLLLILRGFSCK